MGSHLRVRSLVCGLMICWWQPVFGQQKPSPAVAPNPQAPVLAMPMPLGIERGRSLDLLLAGTKLANPTGLLIDFPARTTIPSEFENGQDNFKLKVRLEVPADVPVGYYSLRLATKSGMSNLRLFCIDDLPQVLADEGNRKFETAQSLGVPCVVTGKVTAQAGVYFKITAAAGQRLSFDVLGRRLGSPIDPQLTIYSAKAKREVAYDNDAPGCQTDARLNHVFKEAGDYVVELKDVLGRGGADYVYRLRIGDFPLATVPIPMAARRGTKVKFHFAGPQVEGVQPVEVSMPVDPAAKVAWIAPKGRSGLYGWPVAALVSDMDERLEKEPNDQPAQANRIPVLGGVTGRFQHSDDTDHYIFTAKKGQKLTIEAQTVAQYSPTLVYMVLKKAKPLQKGDKAPVWVEIAKSNPQAPPPGDQRIEFTAAEDADFLVEVQHLTYAGGPSEAYHLTIAPTVPGFDISLGLDRYDVAPGVPLSLNLLVTRKGYTGPIEVSVHDPSHKKDDDKRAAALTKGGEGARFQGSATVKAGESAATLLLTANDDMPPGPHEIMLVAQATIDGRNVIQPVSVQGPISASLSGLSYPPLQLNYRIALAVKDKALKK